MKQGIYVLIGLAALAFLIGTFIRFFGEGSFLGYPPVTYWRGSIGFLGFAVTLILLQIRDKS